MDFLNTLRAMFDQWVAGLEPSDQVTLMAIGLGLMIFAVAALILQRHWENRRNVTRQAPELQEAHVALPGERHVVARQKGDAFLRRLEEMN